MSYLSMRSLLLSSILWLSPAYADYQLNMRQGVTPMSHDIYDLHMAMFWICVGIGIFVFGFLFYSLFKYRKSKGAESHPVHENTLVEITWTVIPFVILIIMAIPATIVLFKLNDDSKADMTIKITGYQWKWKYEYLNQGISFFSNLATTPDQISNQARKNQYYLLEVDKPVVVPIHKKIRFLTTSSDVIHAWWVPEIGVKRDAVPGFITESWAEILQPGIYRGQCAELCGVNHGFMPIVIEAKTEKDFQQWVDAEKAEAAAVQTLSTQKLPFATLMAQGKEKYNAACAACHKADGTGMPPGIPGLKGSSMVTGKPISRHILTVLNGVPNTAMQAFGGQLSDNDLAAIITYERNAWGNDTGDSIQAYDVHMLRKQGTSQ